MLEIINFIRDGIFKKLRKGIEIYIVENLKIVKE